MFLVEVDEEFVRDCEGIEFKNIETALSMILSPECPDSLDLENDKYLIIIKKDSLMCMEMLQIYMD